LEILFAVALMAALLLPIELLRLPPSWLSQVAEGGGEPKLVGDGEQAGAVADSPSGTLAMSMQSGLFTRTVIQRRLEALGEELERLDRDPDIFAKAFHTMVARSAYQALLIDATTLVDQPCAHTGESLDLQLVGPSTELWEELEL
jgi:hypothetical protein